MKVAALRAACEEQGLPTKGAKAVLVARLQDASADPAPTKGGSKKKGKRKAEEAEEEEAPPTKKAKATAPKPKAAAKAKAEPKATAPSSGGSSSSSGGGGGGGGRTADREVPGAGSMLVHCDYDVKLMQTNIDHGRNNNKFYIIQVLTDGSGSYWAWNRWGRLGEVGQSKLEPHGGNVSAAIASFEKKFKAKSGNRWDNIANFVKKNGKYQLVELDENDDGSGGGDAALGKLSLEQIQKGQAVLQDIKCAQRQDIATLSSLFYSFIPTQSGRQRPPPLDNQEIIEAKEALLEFWIRMGFQDMSEEQGMTAIEGVMDLPLPPTLKHAASNISDGYSIKAAQDKGAQLVASGAGSPAKPMSKELYAAILLYTGNSIYRELNATLRSENRAKAKRYFNYLRLFLEAMNCMPKKQVTLWRGISVDLHDAYQVGKVVTWWSVSSCTSEESVARNFMNGCGGPCTLLRLRCSTAMDVSALSFYSHEKESLLAPGTQLRVLSRKRNGRIAEIEVEEVGRAVG